MKTLNGLLLGLASSGVYAVNTCLDPNSTDYRCEISDGGFINLSRCGLSDEDVEDDSFAACLDYAGRAGIKSLALYGNELNTLPDGAFEGLTALKRLTLWGNDFITLPEGVFQDLSALKKLSLRWNDLTTLPEGVFQGLSALKELDLYGNDLVSIPAGVFQGLVALEELDLEINDLTTLPAGLFQDLAALEELHLDGNMECLPATPLGTAVDLDTVGIECGCSIQDVTDNVCGQGMMCTPGAVGYTCAPGPATPAPVTSAPYTNPEAPSAGNWASVIAGNASSLAPIASSEAPTPGPVLATEFTSVPTPAPTSSSEATPTLEPEPPAPATPEWEPAPEPRFTPGSNSILGATSDGGPSMAFPSYYAAAAAAVVTATAAWTACLALLEGPN